MSIFFFLFIFRKLNILITIYLFFILIKIEEDSETESEDQSLDLTDTESEDLEDLAVEDKDSALEEPSDEEDIMSSKKPSSLSSAMRDLSIGGGGVRKRVARGAQAMYQCFGMAMVYPFIIYNFIKFGRLRVRVDFMVHLMKEDSFIPSVSEDGRTLFLTTLLPHIFHDVERVNMAKAGVDTSFSENVHEATAFAESADVLRAAAGIEDTDDPEASCITQEVTLPCVCERQIVDWELQFVPNQDSPDGFPANMQFYHTILSVYLVSIERKTQKKRGTARIIGASPPPFVPPRVHSRRHFPSPLTPPGRTASGDASVASAPPRQQSTFGKDPLEGIHFPTFPLYHEEATHAVTEEGTLNDYLKK